jgi:hypothetical protein
VFAAQHTVEGEREREREREREIDGVGFGITYVAFLLSYIYLSVPLF